MHNHLFVSIVAVIMVMSGVAQAEPPTIDAPLVEVPTADVVKPAASKKEEAPRNYVNMGLGASSGTQGMVICAEVAPLARFAISACGSGAGFLTDQSAPEIAHFRAHLKILSWKLKSVWLEPRVNLGFAEMQVGEDTAGFDFTGTGGAGMSTAGPEGGASLRGLLPLVRGVEFIGELSLGIAYFSHAPELVRPQSAWQPSATMTLGIGF